MKNDYIFQASDGEQLTATAFGGRPGKDARCIIYVHGFKGFKDWGFVPYLGEYLSGKGFFVVTFNFSHNGIGAQPTEFTELDKFARNTFSREIRELGEMVGALRGGVFGPISKPRVGLLGHSRGGGIALLTAAQRTDIDATALWSSVSTFDRYNEALTRKWRDEGYIEIVNQRTGQVMRLDISLLDDLENNRDDLLNIGKAAGSLRGPLLIVHGEKDESVPAVEADELYHWAGDKSEILLVPGTGHTFDAKHPFEGSNDKLDLVLNKTAEFFDKNL
jgi:pimeloyl-ACP methyl ester carboxylesterase